MGLLVHPQNIDFFKAIIENSNDMLIVLAKDGTVIYESPATTKILGYPLRTEPSMARFDKIHIEDKKLVNIKILESIQNPGVQITVIFRLEAVNGNYTVLEGRITNMLDVPGVNAFVTSYTDITASLKIKNDLIKSREKFSSLVNSINGIVWEADINPFQNTFISNQAEEILGYPIEQWLSEKDFWEKHIHPEDKQWVLDNYLSDISTIKKKEFEYRMIAKNGKIVWFRDIITIISENKKPKYLRGILVDITERKKAEHDLLLNEQYYQNLIKQSSSAIILLDKEGQFIYQSPVIEKIVGYTVEEESHTNVFQFVHPDDLEQVQQLYAYLLKNPGISVTRELRFLHQNGHYVWIEGTITNLLADKNVNALIVNYYEITDRKKAEEDKEKSEANLRSIFDNSDTGYILMDNNLSIISFNKPAQKFSQEDLNKTLIEDSNAIDYFSIERQAFMKKKCHEALAGKSIMHEVKYLQADKTLRWYFMRFYPVHNFEKKIFGVVIALNDVTERKTLDLNRQKITQELIQRAKAQEQFTYIVSHNLRSPVANIIGLSNLMNDGELSHEESKEMMNRLAVSAKKLDEVILDLSQILNVNKEVKENMELVVFSELIKDVEVNLNLEISKNNIQIITHFQEEGMLTVKGYLSSIFYNLISNSIKYRQPNIDTIIEVRSLKKAGKIQLIFKDNGLGIDLKTKGDQVFGLYKRFHKNVEGRGMGLYMVKTQVETLGGKISISSKVNEGTEFLIEFDLETH